MLGACVFSIYIGATVVERLDWLPPIKAYMFNPWPEHSLIFASGNCAGRCRWWGGGGGLRDLPFLPPLHSGTAAFSLHFTLICSQYICRTGEVRVTQGQNLPARYVIHTVGPKYNIKYQTAAQNTLHSCYRNVLQKACELELSSIALCVVNSVRRNFPPDEGAHIALRTVRRFLERHGSCLDTVVFAIGNVDIGIYEVLLPLYFPRSAQEEQNALWQLPSNVGGSDGEPIQPDRQIRIIDNPQHALEDVIPSA
ncbi:hypothetical protein PR048_023541 [Dryococelus australis]|uniref:Macro domain-containing protein n=1 Tax=Dryococelus australis TaxID=614101 RepID=A0ABQ9GUE1_9NEOP|nr:hypothetical protein PR048_023541 [Dryococelus australis]